MNPSFFGGAVFGALLMAGILAIAMHYWRRSPRREPDDWTTDFHEPQPVARTRLLIHERTFEF